MKQRGSSDRTLYRLHWLLTIVIVINIGVTAAVWYKLAVVQEQLAEMHRAVTAIGSGLVHVAGITGGGIKNYIKNKIG